MKLLLTGSSGFVGQALYSGLCQHEIIAPTRKTHINSHLHIEGVNSKTDWKDLLKGCDAVVHCAGLAHAQFSEEELREVNVRGTQVLARQAAAEGVKRFVFVSSIKVNGEFSLENKPFRGGDAPNPQDLYAKSKFEAEEQLKRVCFETGMEYVIIRPPLIYGPGVKASFVSMMKWISLGVPLPLGAIRGNRRSLVFIDNLVDLIAVSIEHPAASNQTFLVSDGADVSTRELLRKLAQAMNKRPRLLSVPTGFIGLLGRLLGKRDIEQRLCGSLQVDITDTKEKLDWVPPIKVEEGLKITAGWYGSVRKNVT